MSETPAPYANYPRNEIIYGSSDRLQSLYDAYRKYSWLFFVNIVLYYGLLFGSAAIQSVVAFYLSFPVIMIVFAALTHPLNKKIGFGANWSNGQIIASTVLMALNSVCCGIIGYIVMQQIAVNNIKRYGIKSGFFGLKKKQVLQKIADLQATEGGRV